MTSSEEIIRKLEENLATFQYYAKTKNVGSVVRNTDGIVVAEGLSQSFLSEQVIFEDGTRGVILNLDEDNVSIILLGLGEKIKEGSVVKTTGRVLEIIATDSLLGRVISPLGDPLDGKAKIKKGKGMPLEKIAPGVIEREPVNTPVKTGIKAIDSMIPIGRGQRELIIGDRGLGKTAIAIDTIINQRQDRENKKRKPIICIYVAIGQKQSNVAQTIDKLKEKNAFDYTIVVSAGASDPPALQYLAPYAGCAIAEYFLEKGEDVLIVYDDLTKHAWAYRQISLVLRRPAGREAYPGDIFYLHSRLLERAVKLNKKNGGGSITALPIIETQANDIASYIPTNVISITDGQIYLEGSLFNAGLRPAINVGSSVSRVGGSALTSAMKSVVGKMRLELASYRELAIFAQFGSELDPQTTQRLERGKRTTEILKQPQYEPLPEALEFLSIWIAANGYLDDIPVDSVSRFEKEYHDFIKMKYPKILDSLQEGSRPDENLLKQIEKATAEFKKSYL